VRRIEVSTMGAVAASIASRDGVVARLERGGVCGDASDIPAVWGRQICLRGGEVREGARGFL
jgi:hypothetical protein